jgi:hypothetical protein
VTEADAIPYIAPSPEAVALIKRYEGEREQILQSVVDASLCGVSILKTHADGSVTRIAPSSVYARFVRT